MIGLSGVRLANDPNLEKKAQRVNTLSTGVTAAGIAGTAVIAGEATNRVQHALIKGRISMHSPQNIKMNNIEKAIVKTFKLIDNTKSSISENLTPVLTKVASNNVVQKIAKAGNIVGSFVVGKGKKVVDFAKNYCEQSLHKNEKKAALAAVILLAVSHIYRKGQINGILAAQKQD